MAIDHRIGNKVAPNLRKEDAPGTRVDPYPYLAIVKNNVDPTRSGRLQVWIPDLGGDPDEPLNWRTVSYASPFMGYTTTLRKATDIPSIANTFETTTHSYGMWMVPPDIGVQVIVLFIAGDPLRGYWLACVNGGLSHHMVPGLAGSPNVDGNSLYPADLNSYNKGDIVPVVEFNEYDPNLIGASVFYNNPKPIHTYQYAILRAQGLEKDPIRGAISSSSQRETPSMVFGISTPGRPYKHDPADDKENYIKNLTNNSLPPDWDNVSARKGGHQFVMDDGAPLGEDQLVRLRTANGHQLMMHDTENTLYISHADGTSWLEMTKEGDFKIYTKGSFSVRAEGNMNFHSDSNMNFQANGDIKFKSSNKFQIESTRTTLLTGSLSVETTQSAEFKVASMFNIESGGLVSIDAKSMIALKAPSIRENSGGTREVKGVDALKTLNHADTTYDNITGRWINNDALLNTIVTVAPSHEPYKRAGVPRFYNPESIGIQPQATYTGTVDAIKNVSGTGVSNPAGAVDIRNQPPASGTVGNLSKDQMTAYLAQIGASESRVGTTKGVGNGKTGYQCQNELGFIGKYQFGYQALIDQGYVKSSVTSLAQLDNPNSWTGKDGITDKNAWFSNGSVQESAMMVYTQNNYTAMVANGAITADMPPEEVAGMLSVAHLLGPNEGTEARPGAAGWRKGKGGADGLGTSGDSYFQKGKYAVKVLAPQTAAILNG